MPLTPRRLGRCGGTALERPDGEVVDGQPPVSTDVHDPLDAGTDAGDRVDPGGEQRGEPAGLVERGEARVRGDGPHELVPPCGELARAGAVGVHVPVPREQPQAQLLGGAGGRDPAEESLEGRPGAEPGVGLDRRELLGVPDPAFAEQLGDPARAVGRRELLAERRDRCPTVVGVHDDLAVDEVAAGRRRGHRAHLNPHFLK